RHDDPCALCADALRMCQPLSAGSGGYHDDVFRKAVRLAITLVSHVVLAETSAQYPRLPHRERSGIACCLTRSAAGQCLQGPVARGDALRRRRPRELEPARNSALEPEAAAQIRGVLASEESVPIGYRRRGFVGRGEQLTPRSKAVRRPAAESQRRDAQELRWSMGSIRYPRRARRY